MKFRKKPVVIEALQFIDAMAGRSILAWVNSNGGKAMALGCEEAPEMEIFTLEGNHRAIPGDWIIQGVKGEFYPCKPDIFEATYEPT
ncbi:PGDYG domain-containing protein [Geothrix campi]|uniref:PGDYG domain-containing protein n=1 Tax=Geothrix campi TaxID=2966450 RepID=UPI00214930D2|nr:PGDYG domain-containing protein [Geothrix sp. SG10]